MPHVHRYLWLHQALDSVVFTDIVGASYMCWGIGLDLEFLQVVLSLFGSIDCLTKSHFLHGVILHVESAGKWFVSRQHLLVNTPRLAALGQDKCLALEGLLGFISSQLVFHGKDGAGGFLIERVIISFSSTWMMLSKGAG